MEEDDDDDDDDNEKLVGFTQHDESWVTLNIRGIVWIILKSFICVTENILFVHYKRKRITGYWWWWWWWKTGWFHTTRRILSNFKYSWNCLDNIKEVIHLCHRKHTVCPLQKKKNNWLLMMMMMMMKNWLVSHNTTNLE